MCSDSSVKTQATNCCLFCVTERSDLGYKRTATEHVESCLKISLPSLPSSVGLLPVSHHQLSIPASLTARIRGMSFILICESYMGDFMLD